MNRFFRSGLLPLILIVLVVYLASSQLMGNKNDEKKVTYSEFINKVETGQIESAVFNPEQAEDQLRGRRAERRGRSTTRATSRPRASTSA